MAEGFEETAPTGPELTAYDREHVKLYMRLLDAEADGADWREVASVVFGLDPVREPSRAQAVHASHLSRARWLAESGYRELLRHGLH